ncbi:TPA: SdiA-regulated domain-containing protein [Escherichia coli]|nr:SdiA-regulated domain-containing protein [Escherichia coli]MDR5927466.1 SdiA-regulated domain-containing protein [Escherichia coli]MDR5990757.1 SdiA-regulated domain-containing protein [Escherichia coli]
MFGEYTNPVNKGLEGLTWDGNKQNLFAAKEMKDVIITRANMIRKVRISRSFLPKLTR